MAQGLSGAFWTPCTSKKHLHAWIEKFIGVDFPTGAVCDDEIHAEPTNSSPMDFIWEVYSKGMAFGGIDWDFERVLAYAARDSGKTLAFSILEILAVFHMGRDVAHAAAIEQQAQKCASYVSGFISKKPFREFVYGNNKRTLEFCWYRSQSGVIYPWKIFEELLKKGAVKEEDFVREFRYIKILVATMASLNSEHVSFVALDELDLINPKPYAEALSIPVPTKDGRPPIVVMTSTRKFGFGLVQKEIDDAAHTGLQIRHWNLIDVTEACPRERHLPDEPQVRLYYNTDSLRHVSEADFQLLSPEEQERWSSQQAYAGCARCPIFVPCRARLATKQTSGAAFLKDIREVISVFRRRAKDPDFAKAQLLCWKPGSAGLIYPLLSVDQHVKSAAAMAVMITGGQHPPETSKSELIDIMRAAGCRFFAGMDFGYTHAFAVVVGALWGQSLYIIEALAVTEMELGQRIELCKRIIEPYGATIYPDPAYPSDIQSFRRAGFRMVSFKKDVLEGIGAVRAKIMPSLSGVPEMYFLAGEPTIDLLVSNLRQYHWLLDAAGNPTDEPADDDDDLPDALRYLCQNLFGKKIYRKSGRPPAGTPEQKNLATQAAETNKRIMEQHLQLLQGKPRDGSAGPVYKKNNKFFSP